MQLGKITAEFEAGRNDLSTRTPRRKQDSAKKDSPHDAHDPRPSLGNEGKVGLKNNVNKRIFNDHFRSGRLVCTRGRYRGKGGGEKKNQKESNPGVYRGFYEIPGAIRDAWFEKNLTCGEARIVREEVLKKGHKRKAANRRSANVAKMRSKSLKVKRQKNEKRSDETQRVLT